ncbi:MAG: dTDP-4-dehydrorhamnose 3,5-epimerase family protein [Rhodospirillales bacterium]|nr:dTDP-4-dehydrorhamnose 3,5-epimerase family protein [Rhodospirillales bacterium]
MTQATITRRLTVADTPLAGLKIIGRQSLSDSRGSFLRLFCAEELAGAGWKSSIAQINYTVTSRCGTIRGMHYQLATLAEAKLVSCLKGEVFDVAVDLRIGSPTFMRWHAQRLSADNGRALLIPEGFAHGFQSLTDNVELLYCHSTAYAPHAEAGINPLDSALAIDWPLPKPELSERDLGHPMLTEEFEGVRL